MTNDAGTGGTSDAAVASAHGPLVDHPDRHGGVLSSPERVVTLADGVFAIVLTILVLEIAVPANLSESSLRQVLEELQPTVVAWVISFLLTAMYWVAHRDLFLRIRAVNRDRLRLVEPALPAPGGPRPIRGHRCSASTSRTPSPCGSSEPS